MYATKLKAQNIQHLFRVISFLTVIFFCLFLTAAGVFAEEIESSKSGTYDGYQGVLWKQGEQLHPDFEDNIKGKSYCLMDKSTGRVIMARNENLRLPVASTTKVMTALLSARCTKLDEFFVVDDNAVVVEGSSMGLKPGYSVTMRGLIIGMILKSGNDGANVAAAKVGGTNESFIKMMNDEAVRIGMCNTHFSTPSGLDFGEPYSSAYDMALLARAALNQPELAEICKEKSLFTQVGNPPVPIKYTGHNRMVSEYDGGIGVKTGYTKKAGKCLVSAATRGDITLICTTLNTPDDVTIHKKILDFGFEQLVMTPLQQPLLPQTINILHGKEETAKIASKSSAIPLLKTDNVQPESEIILEKITAPCFVNQIVGEVVHKINGEKVSSSPIYLTQTVGKMSSSPKNDGFINWIKKIFGFDKT